MAVEWLDATEVVTLNRRHFSVVRPRHEVALVPPDAPLSHLAQALAMGFLALVKQLGQDVPEIKDPGALKGGEAIDLVHREVGHLFPGLRQ